MNAGAAVKHLTTVKYSAFTIHKYYLCIYLLKCPELRTFFNENVVLTGIFYWLKIEWTVDTYMPISHLAVLELTYMYNYIGPRSLLPICVT